MRRGRARQGLAGRGRARNEAWQGEAVRGLARQGEARFTENNFTEGAMKKSQMYFGGVPTDLDVEKLKTKFGVPAPGTAISYQAIAECLGISRNEFRWHSVVGAWRRHLDRQFNVILKAMKNDGFVALDPSGRVDYSGRKYKGGLRQVVRAATVAARTDRGSLSPEEVRVCDHIQNTGASLRLAAATAARSLKYEEPVKQANGK